MVTELESFSSEPKAVDKWLELLPIAHIGETARQLYMAMRFANKQENIPVKHHFHLLEGIAEPLSFILPELHKHYAGKPLPLSQKRRKVADLYTQLLRQAIQGYQHVIAHSIELNRFGWKKAVTTSVHRIFAYSSLMIFNYRQLYLPYQKGMWQQLYWIYQLIEKYDLLNTKITGQGENVSKTTIVAEFKKLLLHSLLSPNLFRLQELEEVLDNLDTWTQHVSILDQPANELHQTYAFTLETDFAPALIAQTTNNADNPLIDVRYLDISELLLFINKLLAQNKHGDEKIRINRQRSVTSRTLLLLLNNWGRPASRDGERRMIQGRAEVAIGISAIHFVVSDGRYDIVPEPEPAHVQNTSDQYTIADNTLSPQGGSLGFLGFTAEQDKKTDVWESAYFVPEAHPPSWTESMRMKVYSYLNAKVLNVSKGGCCLALPQDGVEHIQTNELVAIRGKNGQWQLGEIRWMVCPTNAPIRAGIRKISQKVVPALLYIQADKKPTQPIKCLLGEHEDGKQLFISSLPTSFAGKPLSIEINGKIQKLSLREQIYQSPVGSAYIVDIRADQHNAPDTARKDTYESIWASL